MLLARLLLSSAPPSSAPTVGKKLGKGKGVVDMVVTRGDEVKTCVGVVVVVAVRVLVPFAALSLFSAIQGSQATLSHLQHVG